MTNREGPQQPDEPALDPQEKWGQGTDASHPISAIGGIDAATPTVAMPNTTDDPDQRELTDTAERLRRSVPSGRDRSRDDDIPLT